MEKIKKGLEYKFGHWKEGNKYYRESTINGKLVWKEVSTEEFENKLKTARHLAEELQYDLDGLKIFTESIMKLPKKRMLQLEEAVKKKHQRITRQHHCVDMKVGNFILPIID